MYGYQFLLDVGYPMVMDRVASSGLAVQVSRGDAEPWNPSSERLPNHANATLWLRLVSISPFLPEVAPCVPQCPYSSEVR